MKKILVGLSMLLLGGYASAQTHPAPKNTTEILFEQTVQLSVYYQDPNDLDNNDYGGSCAGVWVGSRHVLTSAHCVLDSRVFSDEKENLVGTNLNAIYLDTIDNFRNKDYVAKMRRVSLKKECDLAVLGVIGVLNNQHPIADIRFSDLLIGEKVKTVGHPGRYSWLYTSGEVSALERHFTEDYVYNVININIGHGNSGGGLFDEQNKLVGITRAISESGDERLALYSTQECIKDILVSAKESEAKKKRTW